ncbi:MAG TPA: hypothetical protein DDY18_06145 [Flavobacterium sp.]|jgi:hypothetical protein|nr:hypothetical protein [Flavobacterium sp.]
MKWLILTLLSLQANAQASIPKQNDRLIKFIKTECDFLNTRISFDKRMDCVTDYLNCAIVGSGDVDLDQMLSKECLKAAAKRRENAQLQD